MCVTQKIGGIIRGFIFSFFVDVPKHLILPQRSYNGQDSTCVSHCHTSDWVCFSDQKSYRRLISLNTGRRNNFPTSGHFIALINQTNPPYWRLARKNLEEKKNLHSILTACSGVAAARIFCRFTGRKCHLAQTGVASTDTIDSQRSEALARGGGKKGVHTLPSWL